MTLFAFYGTFASGQPGHGNLAGAEFVVWDDPGVDWAAYDRVVLRSVWDYSSRVEEFLGWCTAVGPQRVP